MRAIKYLVVHCSATPENKPFTAKDIDRWHKQRGFRCIGYHYVILLDGTIQTGRKESEIGAHVSGYNSNSIGICYIGGCDKSMKPKDTRTPEQKESLIKILTELKKKYPAAIIMGHRDFPKVAKACPSFNAKSEYQSI